jgi:hypothetical protein
MVVLDGFLDRVDFLTLRSALEAPGFPWERSRILSPASTDLDPARNVQLVHGFYLRRHDREIRSPHLDLLRPLLAMLQPLELIKVKANRTFRQDRHLEYGLHVDTRRPEASTAILYLNTNNGYTVFEDGRQVGSMANRVVIFDAGLRHSGAACTDTDSRLVLNLNLLLPAGRFT